MSLFLFPRFFLFTGGQLDRLTSCLTLTGTGARPRTAAAAVLHVGRLVEDRVTRAEGPRDARHWTKVIADAEEADWLDLGTVQGGKRIDMAQVRFFLFPCRQLE